MLPTSVILPGCPPHHHSHQFRWTPTKRSVHSYVGCFPAGHESMSNGKAHRIASHHITSLHENKSRVMELPTSFLVYHHRRLLSRLIKYYGCRESRYWRSELMQCAANKRTNVLSRNGQRLCKSIRYTTKSSLVLHDLPSLMQQPTQISNREPATATQWHLSQPPCLGHCAVWLVQWLGIAMEVLDLFQYSITHSSEIINSYDPMIEEFNNS